MTNVKAFIAPFAFALLAIGSSGVIAAETAAVPKAECATLWSKATQGGKTKLNEAEAAPYLKDFKAANPDGDTTIEETEWLAACDKGMIHAAMPASAPATTGTVGDGKTSDRTPDKSPERQPGSTSAGAPGVDAAHPKDGTSDRTPEK